MVKVILGKRFSEIITPVQRSVASRVRPFLRNGLKRQDVPCLTVVRHSPILGAIKRPVVAVLSMFTLFLSIRLTCSTVIFQKTERGYI